MEHYLSEWEIGKISSSILNGDLVVLRDGSTKGFLVCSALNSETIERAFQIKGKAQANALVLYCASLSMVEKYSDKTRFTHQAYRLCEQLWPSTAIALLPTANCIPEIVSCGMNATGFCCPTSRFLRQLSCLLNAPIVLISVKPDVIDANDSEIGVTVDCCNLFPAYEAVVIDCREGLRRIDHPSDATVLSVCLD